MYIVQTFTGFAHRDKPYCFKVQTGKDIAWSMAYLGASFLQKRRIHFPPADAKMQIKPDLVQKSVSNAISMIILSVLGNNRAFPQYCSVVENTILGLINKKQFLLIIFTANNSLFNVSP